MSDDAVCVACGEPIPDNDGIEDAAGRPFHLECWTWPDEES